MSQQNRQPSEEQQYKIVPNLTFITGYFSNKITKDQLSSIEYLGQYGTIKNICLKKKGQLSQILVAFSSDAEAALALIALNGFKYGSCNIKVQYGKQFICKSIQKKTYCTKINCNLCHSPLKKSEQTLLSMDQTVYAKKIIQLNSQELYEKINLVNNSIFPCAKHLLNSLLSKTFKNQLEDDTDKNTKNILKVHLNHIPQCWEQEFHKKSESDNQNTSLSTQADSMEIIEEENNLFNLINEVYSNNGNEINNTLGYQIHSNSNLFKIFELYNLNDLFLKNNENKFIESAEDQNNSNNWNTLIDQMQITETEKKFFYNLPNKRIINDSNILIERDQNNQLSARNLTN